MDCKASCTLIIAKLTYVQIKERKLTRWAPMMRPMVSAASDPAYIFAMATAPHDMKLKAACAIHATMLYCVLQVSRCIEVAHVEQGQSEHRGISNIHRRNPHAMITKCHVSLLSMCCRSLS